jgi:hypothetical protein
MTTRVRLVVFALIATFMFFGPIYRQVFDGKNKIFKNWIMFSHRGSGLIDARFSLVMPDGSERSLNRYEILNVGEKKPKDMPRNTWWIRTRHGGVAETAKRLCKALGPAAVLRIQAREATPRGWDTN